MHINSLKTRGLICFREVLLTLINVVQENKLYGSLFMREGTKSTIQISVKPNHLQELLVHKVNDRV